MKKASLAAAFAASLSFGWMSAGFAADDRPAEDALVAEERLLGAADDEARFSSYQPFTREIAVDVVVQTTAEAALGDAAAPMATMLEALHAFAATLDLARDVKPGDHVYVRYEQTFTAEGTPVDVGHVVWAELKQPARTVLVHRFRTHDKVERLWFLNGLSATPPSMRMPLDVISVSSGFGLRADPFDQPAIASAWGRPAPMGGPRGHAPLPPGLPTGGVSGNGGTNAGSSFGLPMGVSGGLAGNGAWPAMAARGAAPVRNAGLFMHEGMDLVAPAGTPVYAAADGIVVGAAPNGRYGNWIRIDHGNKLATVYGHLMAFAPGIEPGEAVVRGEVIGFVGTTGRSTGAHLHFEVQNDGRPVNPINHPELKTVQLRGLDFERFKKQVAQSLEERAREAKAATTGL
jgi:murein DD-endopeptidase MepM/ murein hydrolase activator NlpD